MSDRRFLGFAALAVLVGLVPVLLWVLSESLLLAFGAVLFATLIQLAAEPLDRWAPLPVCATRRIAVLVIAIALPGGGWLFGSRLVSEFSDDIKRAEVAASA